jgi:hypothetical protein
MRGVRNALRYEHDATLAMDRHLAFALRVQRQAFVHSRATFAAVPTPGAVGASDAGSRQTNVQPYKDLPLDASTVDAFDSDIPHDVPDAAIAEPRCRASGRRKKIDVYVEVTARRPTASMCTS